MLLQIRCPICHPVNSIKALKESLSSNTFHPICSSGGSRLGPGGTGPPNLTQAPQIFRVITVHKLLNTGQLDTVVLLVVVSQMMRGQALPQIFFRRTAPDMFHSYLQHKWILKYLILKDNI